LGCASRQLGLGVLLALCTYAAPAAAYVCATTPGGGAALAWKTRSVGYAFNQNVTTKLNQQTAIQTVARAFDTWQNLTTRTGQNCPAASTGMRFVRANNTTDQAYIGYNFLAPDDNLNLILFRDDKWPYEATTGDDLVARTTVTYNNVSGTILDADIEFNTAKYTFTTSDTGVQTDLGNTATHEVGHLLGFAHSSNQAAAMALLAPTNEIFRRTLACDDVAIMAFRYPAGTTDVGSCFPATGLCGFCAPPGAALFKPTLTIPGRSDGLGGCQAAAAGPATAGWAGVLLGWRLLLGRQRRGRLGR
jgi:hypothetical protein